MDVLLQVPSMSLCWMSLGFGPRLVFHAAVVVILHLLLRRRLRNTMRFHVASYLTLSFISVFFACRAVDLSLGHKEWEEGRQRTSLSWQPSAMLL